MMNKQLNCTNATLLIVDDNIENLDVLITYLEKFKYKIMVAQNGLEAIELVQEFIPDLILLDVMMPGIDGFETCLRLRKNEESRMIPIIFMTALSNSSAIIKGFEVGGVDYITKPLQLEEVSARIKTHLTIRLQQRKLEEQNKKLIKLNKEKDDFLGIASHDLKNPISCILGYARFLEEEGMKAGLEEITSFSQQIQNSSKHMLNLLKNLLDINRIESGEMHFNYISASAKDLVIHSMRRFKEQARSKGIAINAIFPENNIFIETDVNAMAQVLDNLLSNAIKFSPKGQNITLIIKELGDSIQFLIEDEGPGLTETDLERLFGKFARLSARPTNGESSTGLGLSIVQKIVNSIGGKVFAEDRINKTGVIFVVELPKKSKLE